MLFGILVLITALAISSVAIWYSVAGLVAIFSAAAVPIIIMGVVLEVGKLVTAVWLHNYWSRATWWLKTYLSAAVLVLMFITSMGIFGFLSKAHIEQTAASDQSLAQIERLDSKLEAEQAIIDSANQRINQFETSGSSGQQNIQQQIVIEEGRIQSVLERIQPQINEQQEIINKKRGVVEDQITRIDNQIAKLEGHLANDEIALAQGMVGVVADGRWGRNSAVAVGQWQEQRAAEREVLLTKLEDISTDPVVTTARAEIARIREQSQKEIDRSNSLIDTYSQQLTSSDENNLSNLIAEQRTRIREASAEFDALTDEKFSLQSEYRKLEAEVGPIRYIAEFIYGENASQNLLEEAVRWVIVIIIFVFDPLAVLLLIAAQYTFSFARENRPTPPTDGQKKTEELDEEEDEYFEEAAVEDNETEENSETDEEEQDPEEVNPHVGSSFDDYLQEEAVIDDLKPYGIETPVVEYDEFGNPIPIEEYAEAYHKKKLIESLAESNRRTLEEIEELEDNNGEWSRNKKEWKEQNPDRTIKEFKIAYENEKIDYLPWDPDFWGYKQNDEQNENSIWNKIRNGSSGSNTT
jgi:hypothetical protein